MLLVKTYIMYSEIDGFGLFAGEDISKGTKVWEFNSLIDKKLSSEEVKTLPQVIQRYLSKYSWGNKDGYQIALDNDKYVNSSKDPNVIEEEDYKIAARDIAEDEEITQKYGDFN